MTTWTYPNEIQQDTWSTNLVSTSTHQYCALYTLANEIVIGRRERNPFGAWETFELAGAARTAMACPVSLSDQHNWVTIAVTNHNGVDNSNDVLHVLGNMHNHPLRYVKSGAGSIVSWFDATGDLPVPTDIIRWSYPIPAQMADGKLWLYMRTSEEFGGSGRSDSHFWIHDGVSWSAPTKIGQGLRVPNAGGPGIPGSDATSDEPRDGGLPANWNMYIAPPYVESDRNPHPGRIHIFGMWHRNATWERGDNDPFYIWSDDGEDWFAIDGTPVTFPITPIDPFLPLASNNPAIYTGTSDPLSNELRPDDGSGIAGPWGGPENDPEPERGGYSHPGGTPTIDPQGYPVHLCNTQPWCLIRWNGTAWQQEEFNPAPYTGAWRPNGPGTEQFIGEGTAIYRKNKLHALSIVQGPGSNRRVALWELDETPKRAIRMTGPVHADDGVKPWYCTFDREAFRRFNTVEVWGPNGDTPHVVTFGDGPVMFLGP